MNSKSLIVLAALALLPSSALAAGKAKKTPSPAASPTPVKKVTPPGVSEASVAAAVNAFVDALNSLEEAQLLASLAPSDRITLKGQENLIGLVNPRKLLNPSVKSFEKLMDGSKLVGAKAIVSVEEVDPISGTNVPKEKTWYLSLDSNVLKVSLTGIWLDDGRIKEEQQ